MNVRVWGKEAAALSAAVMLVCGIGTLQADGAPQYGTMVVEQGAVTVIREGKSLSFKESPTSVSVNQEDLIRVREASKVTLTTSDKGKVTFGANAIFSCKPWEAANRTGILRLVYGRMRALALGLGRSESFNVKTVEAVVGVKGTEYGLIQTNSGRTMVLGIENTVTLTGADNQDQPVAPDQFSSVSPGQGATPPFEAPEGLKAAIANLNSPPPNAPQGGDVPTFEFRSPRDFQQFNLDDSQQAGAQRRTGVIIKINP